MEVRFEKRILPCLRRDLWQTQDREQTQEVRLPEGMPDIGGVLAAWGQCVLRSKEWLGDSITVSGGVMTWILYEPADGTEPRTIEAWLPIQGKWNLPQTQREGMIRSSWLLRGMDARTVSARKMMVRANVSLLAEVLEPWDAEVYGPAALDPDVQLLRRTYPAVIPKEVGEKAFLLEEELPLEEAQSIIHCRLVPRLTEQKVIGGKAVFRGEGALHLLYRREDGQLRTADFQLPFSQFSELDRDYDKDATLSVMLVVSNLEPEISDGKLLVKCGIVAQYMVQDLELLELVEDAYSNRREIRIQRQPLELPMVLDSCPMDLHCQVSMPGDGTRVVDNSLNYGHPKLRRAGDLTELELSGTVQMLYHDENGALRGTNAQWADAQDLPGDSGAAVLAQAAEGPELRQEGANLRGDIQVAVQMTDRQGIEMVTGLELGSVTAPDPGRPSVILRRAGEHDLWNLAKNSGSTVDAILRANGLTTEPVDDRMLLIPIA
ncbi:MAG: DUF3794 domain-containing protein [Oscillospiraceae bacterium]|nr:DUF3794 domain-containing protein [Oscillospiraceae bacterium]